MLCIGFHTLATANAVQWQSRISRRGGMDPLGGCGPQKQALFGKNVCENERIGSRGGACTWHAP